MFSMYLWGFPLGSLVYSNLLKHASRFIGYCKLIIGMNECVYGTVMYWCPIWSVFPALHPGLKSIVNPDLNQNDDDDDSDDGNKLMN